MDCKLQMVTVTGLQLSDLFFNHEKAEYDQVDRRSGTAEEINERERQALLNAATEFSDMVGNQVTAQLLVEDFMARI